MNSIVNAGVEDGRIELRIDRKFLELFSEQLYSSANKAFEELVSNSWDAGASEVHILFPPKLDSKDAAICVLDDGVSMDATGLQDLWHIGSSPKRTSRHRGRKHPIGKFGIGKLATYILAGQITYVCRYSDGIIRLVTLDYENLKTPVDEIEMHQMKLPLRTISPEALATELALLTVGPDLITQINNINKANQDYPGTADSQELNITKTDGTWTLVILTNLRPKGKDIEVGRLNYMLRASLPLGEDFKIFLNADRLISTKSSTEKFDDWTLGTLLEDGAKFTAYGDSEGTEYEIKREGDAILVEELGQITGNVTLYKDSISGGKSSQVVGDSEGFYISVLGRVVNLGDPMFGLDNLKHGVFTRFRAEVRCDELDNAIKVDREKLVETEQLRIFRGILSTIFNKARRKWEAGQEDVTTAEIRAVLDDTWQIAPAEPLSRFVEEAMDAQPYVTSLLRDSSDDKAKSFDEWRKEVKRSPKSVIENVELSNDLSAADPLSVYDISRRTLMVNSKHPFVRRTDNSDSGEILRVLTLTNLLADSYLLDLGLSPSQIDDFVLYRDKMLRLVNRAKRRDVATLVELLEHAGTHEKGLEKVLHESFAALGFDVTPLGQSGEPEGYADAILSTDSESNLRTYRFTYDAKSSAGKVQTGNVHIAGLVRHRTKYNAKYAIFVGPSFQKGALEEECEKHEVTPLECDTLAELLRLTAEYGRIPLVKFESLFSQRSPTGSRDWVEQLRSDLQNSQRLTMNILLDALVARRGVDIPITAEILADQIRKDTGQIFKVSEVQKILQGLCVVVPAFIEGISTRQYVLNVDPVSLVEEVRNQMNRIRPRES